MSYDSIGFTERLLEQFSVFRIFAVLPSILSLAISNEVFISEKMATLRLQMKAITKSNSQFSVLILPDPFA